MLYSIIRVSMYIYNVSIMWSRSIITVRYRYNIECYRDNDDKHNILNKYNNTQKKKLSMISKLNT